MIRERGMTLLEMIVAMFIVLVMMTFLVPLYLRTMKVKSRTEEVAALHATGRGAMGVLRRDLAGAFRTAVAMYDFGSTHRSGAEFHWEAPVDSAVPADPAKGFRRLTFVSAVDGSRLRTVPPYPLYPCEYEVVSWAVRGGVFFRQVGSWKVMITATGAPTGWTMMPAAPNDEGVALGGEIYSGAATFADVGTYRGTSYIQTATTTELPKTLQFRDPVGTLVSMTVTLCVPSTSPLPDWASDFAPVSETVAGTVTYALYSKLCPTGTVTFGANASTPLYFVMLEPAWWSLGEEAEDLRFYAPSTQMPTDLDTDGIYTGGVPRYVDIRLGISDPDYQADLASPGVRTFCERVAIPAGVEP